jgi:hypothetical protein
LVTFDTWPVKGVKLSVTGSLAPGTALDADALERYSDKVLSFSKAAGVARRIRSLTFKDREVTARVPGSRKEVYTTTVRVTSRSLSGYCTCPVASDCKHAGALVILAVAARDVLGSGAPGAPGLIEPSRPAPGTESGAVAARTLSLEARGDSRGVSEALEQLGHVPKDQAGEASRALLWLLEETLKARVTVPPDLAGAVLANTRRALSPRAALEPVIQVALTDLDATRLWLRNSFKKPVELEQVIDCLYELRLDPAADPASRSAATRLLSELGPRVLPKAELDHLGSHHGRTYSAVEEFPYLLL